MTELEPTAIISALSKFLLKSEVDSIPAGCGSSERVERMLSLVENGSTDVVKKCVTVLKDLGYEDILNLVYPKNIKVKAGKQKLIDPVQANAIYTCRHIGKITSMAHSKHILF